MSNARFSLRFSARMSEPRSLSNTCVTCSCNNKKGDFVKPAVVAVVTVPSLIVIIDEVEGDKTNISSSSSLEG